ncbi:type IV pilus biogenesis protein PilM [Cytobacillus massiliigabonensis]|uniref:type IV pilus biogenesis protein PilM n=1 Tax=Cytobacillus massiliigabonensis TaxID=1871011 RepID=UPI000C85C405|nr:hypothetical protein [Cytobacillus massiliigabonensis]
MLRNNKFSGIDFHDTSISYATIKMERGMPVLQNIGKKEIHQEIIVGGRTTNKDLLLLELKDLLKNGSISKYAHLAIPTQNILVRKITSLPDIGENELAKLLQFQIGESIHLPFENPIYDFVKIGSLASDKLDKFENAEDQEEDELSLDELAKGIEENMDGPKSELLLFATSQLLAQDLADLCISAGLKPLSAEIRGLALQRLLFYAHPRWLKETEMIVDASEESVDIHIFKENIIVFSRMMSINRNDYYSSPQDNHDDEVLLLEEELSHIDSYLEVAVTKEEPKNLVEETYVNEIILEIERAQNFFRYSLNERDSEFKRIIVTGEKANEIFEPLKERMETEGIVRIDYSSILANNFMKHDLLDASSVAIGLAIRANEKNKKR